MRKGQPSRLGKSDRRRKAPPRSKRIVLRPGQRLETPTVIVIARKRPQGGGGGGAVTDVSCECTAAEPDKPDCKPVTTKSPDGNTIRVKCNMTGGCSKCRQSSTTTSVSDFMA